MASALNDDVALAVVLIFVFRAFRKADERGKSAAPLNVWIEVLRR